MGKKIYFLSDVHLGSAYHQKGLSEDTKQKLKEEGKDIAQYVQHNLERKLCRWLDMVKADAEEIYLMGDIFDYWFEYAYVVPRGYTRFLGKLSELCDLGIKIHFFIGNHDIWLTNYLEKECGLTIHRQAAIKEIYGKKFFLAHGDGLGDESRGFKLLRAIFHSRWCRIAYAAIHPRWTVGFAYWWSNHNRETGEMAPYMGEDKEHLVKYAKKQFAQLPDANFFIFGHRHIMLDLMLSSTCRTVILGDWLREYSYGVFDGKNFSLEIFEE